MLTIPETSICCGVFFFFFLDFAFAARIDLAMALLREASASDVSPNAYEARAVSTSIDAVAALRRLWKSCESRAAKDLDAAFPSRSRRSRTPRAAAPHDRETRGASIVLLMAPETVPAAAESEMPQST